MDIELTRQFIKVVQNGSFSRAAELLKIPKSTVSKAISRLESETGTKLLLRTTRSLTLTATGRVFYESCLGPIQAIEDAQKSLYGQDRILSGVVRITAPEDLGSEVIAPAIGRLTRQHSALNFDLQYTDDIIDLIRDGFDLAVRIGKLSESSLKVKKIGELILIPVAAPAYLKSAEKIRTPKDLERHQCLAISASSAGRKWQLKSKKETVVVTIKPRIESNQMTSLLKMAKAGAGVAFVPRYLCRNELEKGLLVRLLPEWSGIGLQVSMLSPLASGSSARLKLVGDSLFAEIQKALQA